MNQMQENNSQFCTSRILEQDKIFNDDDKQLTPDSNEISDTQSDICDKYLNLEIKSKDDENIKLLELVHQLNRDINILNDTNQDLKHQLLESETQRVQIKLQSDEQFKEICILRARVEKLEELMQIQYEETKNYKLIEKQMIHQQDIVILQQSPSIQDLNESSDLDQDYLLQYLNECIDKAMIFKKNIKENNNNNNIEISDDSIESQLINENKYLTQQVIQLIQIKLNQFIQMRGISEKTIRIKIPDKKKIFVALMSDQNFIVKQLQTEIQNLKEKNNELQKNEQAINYNLKPQFDQIFQIIDSFKKLFIAVNKKLKINRKVQISEFDFNYINNIINNNNNNNNNKNNNNNDNNNDNNNNFNYNDDNNNDKYDQNNKFQSLIYLKNLANQIKKVYSINLIQMNELCMNVKILREQNAKLNSIIQKQI